MEIETSHQETVERYSDLKEKIRTLYDAYMKRSDKRARRVTRLSPIGFKRLIFGKKYSVFFDRAVRRNNEDREETKRAIIREMQEPYHELAEDYGQLHSEVVSIIPGELTERARSLEGDRRQLREILPEMNFPNLEEGHLTPRHIWGIGQTKLGYGKAEAVGTVEFFSRIKKDPRIKAELAQK